MGIKISTFEEGNRLFINFGEESVSGNSLTMSVFTRKSIDLKIWENKHKCTAQVFVDVDDLLRAADLIRDMRKDLKRK